MSPKPHKYRAKPTIVDGIRFASKKEANRYCELQLLQKSGNISRLVLQQSFPLKVISPWNLEEIIIGKYKADFAYIENNKLVVEDVKGYLTQIYRWKKKHFEAQYNIRIRET